MKDNRNKMMADLQRLIDSQDFKSEKELNDFLASIIPDGKVPKLEKEALSPSELAQDLVFEAYELPEKSAKELVDRALMLDSQCIEAYEFLGDLENHNMIANIFYSIGIGIGKEKYGGKYLKENKGHFWGLHETRPYMRCLQQYANCQYAIGNKLECIETLEELISLNPNDNQGARNLLLLYLIEINDKKKYKKYRNKYKEDRNAFSLFNHGLFLFKTNGNCEESNSAILEALNYNKFVYKKLISKNHSHELPDHYGIGDKKEAQYYSVFSNHIWHDTEGALNWLKQQYKKK